MDGEAGQGARRDEHRVFQSPARERGWRGGWAPNAPAGRAEEPPGVRLSSPPPPLRGLGACPRRRRHSESPVGSGSNSRKLCLKLGAAAAGRRAWALRGPSRRERLPGRVAVPAAPARSVDPAAAISSSRPSRLRPARRGRDLRSYWHSGGCQGEPRRRPRRFQQGDRRPGGRRIGPQGPVNRGSGPPGSSSAPLAPGAPG